jgi:hypothetical protein
MLAIKVICPHCRKHLKTSKPLTVGHRVLCSRCGRSFSVPADAAAGADNGSPPHAPAMVRELSPPSPRLDPAHVETRPDVSMPSPANNRQMLAIGLVLGGLLFVLTLTIVLVLYFALRKGPQETPVPASLSPSEAENSAANAPSPETANVPPPRDDEVPPPPPASGGRQDPPRLPDPTLATAGAPAETAQASWLLPEEQEQVNKAIDRGVEWLKKHQKLNGNWGGRVGLAALPALTLLECGVKADDICIQKALRHVRLAVPSLRTTYDLALVILFLDRLSDPADKKLIQTCALRLVAGQWPSGGWSYDCPILHPKQEIDLLTVMRARRPKGPLDLFVGGSGGSVPPGFIAHDPNASLDKDIQGEPSGDFKLLPEGGPATPDSKPPDKDRPSPAEAKRAWNRLPAELRKLPSLQPPQKSHKLPPRDASDNSNTQFAILGLLAAGRHDLPLERTYALIVQRFHVSQVPDGRWNYHYSSPARPADERPAMTGSGLLGLAVQYGLAHDQARSQAKPGQFKDPAVEKGFDYLAQFIGKPLGAKKPRNRKAEINLYFLWTVERCGVLFKRRQIGGKDWYRWGAELLIDAQQDDGSWNNDGYFTRPAVTPITDTCFALLFLKRANLAKELTKKLEFFMEGKQLQTGP